MTLMSFTSVMKYVLGLMLAMLGFIPYESIEPAPESKINSADSVILEKITDQKMSDTVDFKSVLKADEIVTPDIHALSHFENQDSLEFVFIRKDPDSIFDNKKMLVIVQTNSSFVTLNAK